MEDKEKIKIIRERDFCIDQAYKIYNHKDWKKSQRLL